MKLSHSEQENKNPNVKNETIKMRAEISERKYMHTQTQDSSRYLKLIICKHICQNIDEINQKNGGKAKIINNNQYRTANGALL